MKILMVEDDALTAEMYSVMLKKRGYEVAVIGDGSEAFHLIHSQDFDLIMLDIMLPNMDGLAILRRLRAQPKFQTVPILVITAMTKNTIHSKAMAAGATELLIKEETSLKKLGDTVATLLALQPTSMIVETVAEATEKRGAEDDFRVNPPEEQPLPKLQMVAPVKPAKAKFARPPSPRPLTTTPPTSEASPPPASPAPPPPPPLPTTTPPPAEASPPSPPVAPVITREMVTLKKEPGLVERWFGLRKKQSK